MPGQFAVRAPRTGVMLCCALLPGMVLVGCGGADEVNVIAPRRGKIRESFSEPARTRLANTYRITVPVSGRIARIDLDPGDEVKAGQALAQYDLVPFEQAVAEAEAAVRELEARMAVKDDDRLEETALEQVLALVAASQQAFKAAESQVEAEKARSDRAATERTRMGQLAARKEISQSLLEDAILAAETALIELRRKEFDRAAMKAMLVAIDLGPRFIREYLGRKRLERNVLVQQLAQARARLARARHALKLADVRSPIDGTVLERYDQGDSTLPEGHPLLLLGNLRELEMVADVLTRDALRLSTGSPVSLDPGLRLEPIAGKVKRIEPAAFTKFSSLGVEQQRVRVIVSFLKEPQDLGVGYRLQARFETGLKTDALIVPRFSVLQAPDGSFYVFNVVDGRLKKQPVQLGLRSDLEIEVTAGITERDTIVAQPDSSMKEGMKVRKRSRPAESGKHH